METYSALLAFCAGNSPVPGEFPSQRPVTRSVDVSLIYAWINGWVNNREVCDLWRHRSRYDVIVMISMSFPCRNNNVPPWIFQCTALLFDITWTPWHLKSPVIRIFFKSAFRLTTNKTKKTPLLAEGLQFGKRFNATAFLLPRLQPRLTTMRDCNRHKHVCKVDTVGGNYPGRLSLDKWSQNDFITRSRAPLLVFSGNLLLFETF